MLVKLQKDGQVAIPKTILDQLGIDGAQTLLVGITDAGAIVLRPIAAQPIELYTDERICEFIGEDELSPKLNDRIRNHLSRTSTID